MTTVAPGGGPTWDVGTGNGQAAVRLAGTFAPVYASDASRSQLGAATTAGGVHYLAARAEAAPFPSGSIRLITVAQAVHWFDLPAFFDEVLRLLAPGGVVALWSYGSPTLDDAVDAVYREFWSVTLARHWPLARKIVDEGYASLAFPDGMMEVPGPDPPIELHEDWPLDRVLGYAMTWSGTRRLLAAEGPEAVAPFRRALGQAWGDPTERRPIRWPLAVRAARREG